MSLLDELKKSPPIRQRGAGRLAFLALKNEINEALEAGYSSAQIWEHLNAKGTMPVQYRQFVRYVKKFIGAKTVVEDQQVRPEAEPMPVQQSKSVTPSLTRRFEYNAMGKSLDDLI